MNFRKILRLVAINLAVLAGCIVLVDLLFGLIYKRTTINLEKNRKLTEETTAPPKHLLSPYFGWIETPGTTLRTSMPQNRIIRQSENNYDPDWLDIPTNNMGFISHYDIPIVKKHNDILIVILGGSVARWFALQSSKELISQIEQHSYFKGNNIILLNLATGGYKQPQQLNLLNFLIINSTIPDIVINIDGFNEAALSYSNLVKGVSPIYPSHSHWAHLTKGSALTPEISQAIKDYQDSINKRDYYLSLYRTFSYSNILSYYFSKRINHWDNEVIKKEIIYTEKCTKSSLKFHKITTIGPIYKVGLNDIVNIWINSSKLMHDVCKRNGIEYFHFLQPTPHDPDNYKLLTREEVRLIGPKFHLWTQGVVKLYPMFKARSDELRKYGVLYKDLTNIFSNIKTTLYYDICHFNQKGNDLFAQSIANYIKENIEGTH